MQHCRPSFLQRSEAGHEAVCSRPPGDVSSSTYGWSGTWCSTRLCRGVPLTYLQVLHTTSGGYLGTLSATVLQRQRGFHDSSDDIRSSSHLRNSSHLLIAYTLLERNTLVIRQRLTRTFLRVLCSPPMVQCNAEFNGDTNI